jgi:hypothetical protein
MSVSAVGGRGGNFAAAFDREGVTRLFAAAFDREGVTRLSAAALARGVVLVFLFTAARGRDTEAFFFTAGFACLGVSFFAISTNRCETRSPCQDVVP